MSRQWTILEILDWTRDYFTQKGIETARLDAEVLLAHTLDLQRLMLYAHFDRPVAEPERDRFRELVKRRAKGEPVSYLVGTREFWSLDFEINRDVLIPRPDTEVLVEVALSLLEGRAEPRIADVGTGSGCVALALAKELPAARVEAFDVSPAACAVARRNAERHGLGDRVEVFESDLLSARAEARFDLVVANLPYIRTHEISGLAADVRDFEPRLALDGGRDGLDLIRRLAASARTHLVPGGAIALEAGYDQLEDVAALLKSTGYANVDTRKDYGGNPRVAWGRKGELDEHQTKANG